MSDIARALERKPGTLHRFLSENGGIAPRARTRHARTLSLGEREEISRGLATGVSMRAIARKLGRSPSTISREIARAGGTGAYRATDADARAWQKARRPKMWKLAVDAKLRRLVARKLSQDWSPAQISGWLKATFLGSRTTCVSHETIYRSLFIQARGVLKKELQAHLRSRRRMRRSQKASTAGQRRGQIPDAVSIRERPAEAEDRAVPGHWEGDLLTGSANTHIATLVERSSRFTMLVKVAGKDTQTVTAALRRQIVKLPKELRRSLTWDRGGEMANHGEFSVHTGVKVYFCDPQSPWQRGTNENTNGLLRQYFPKGTRLDGYTQRQLDAVAHRLNTRPRKTLSFAMPADILGVALTG
jgi:IS30 family transposase